MKCPNGSAHIVKSVFFSQTLFYDYCTECKEDIGLLAKLKGEIPMTAGTFLDSNQNPIASLLSPGSVCVSGKSKSGKSFIANSLLSHQVKTNPHSKIIIIDCNDQYKQFIQDNKGVVLSYSSSLPLESTVEKNQTTLIQIPKTKLAHRMLEQLIEQITTISNQNAGNTKIQYTFLLDCESLLSEINDLNPLVEVVRTNRKQGRFLVLLNSDPLFKNCIAPDDDLNFMTSNINNNLFCGFNSGEPEKIKDTFSFCDNRFNLLLESGRKYQRGKSLFLKILKTGWFDEYQLILHKIDIT